ncbi:MAG: hypothetical protein IKD10_03205 [Lentisphaeria bacterium]|nr:hypothetical protein [Lentisphaeria bacterium]MBR7143928.1 hypothetical protein [Lentisphaeria bacterium]
MKIKLYYYSAGNNFGDAVNPLILNKLFDLEHEMVSAGAAQLFMIGSILQKKCSLPQKFSAGSPGQ